ncbi:hypothetical protein ACFWSF_22765 [Streptomyces sp. NPDC058611]|uniref:hypothetical protein n=1 Tax=unclassified Streptomyces TaxID=2593676 RepID=UPI003665A8C5
MTRRRALAGALAATIGALTLAALFTQAGAVEASGLPSTPQAYVAWLEVKGETGAIETATQFKALPHAKQVKFMDYLNKPDHVKAFMEVLNDPAAKQKVLAGGDIVLSKETSNSSGASNSPALSPMGATGEMNAWHSVSDTLSGSRSRRSRSA